MNSFLSNYFRYGTDPAHLFSSVLILLAGILIIRRYIIQNDNDGLYETLKNTYTIVAIFLYILGSSHFIFNYLPNQPDEITYITTLNDVLSSDHLPISVIAYDLFMLPFKYLGLTSQFDVVAINAVLYVIGVKFLTDSTYVVFSNMAKLSKNTYNLHFLILLSLYPSVLLFIARPMREAAVIFLLGTILKLFLPISRRIAEGPIRSALVPLSVFIALFSVLVAMRPPFIFVYAGLLLSIFALHNKNAIRIFVTVAIFGIVALIAIIQVLGYGYLLDPELFAAVRNIRVLKIPDTYGIVNWKSWGDVLLDLPYLTAAFILSPLLAVPDPFRMAAALADALFVLTVMAGATFLLVRRRRNLTVPILIWLATLAVSIPALGLYEYHAGGAVRHRMPIVLSMLPLAVPVFAMFLTKLKQLRNFGHRITV